MNIARKRGEMFKVEEEQMEGSNKEKKWKRYYISQTGKRLVPRDDPIGKRSIGESAAEPFGTESEEGAKEDSKHQDEDDKHHDHSDRGGR